MQAQALAKKRAEEAEDGGGSGAAVSAMAAAAAAAASAMADGGPATPTPTPAAAADADGAGAAVERGDAAGGGGGGAAAAAAPASAAKPTFLDYFDPRNHEEETEIESGIAEKKTSRVGEAYQCPLPAVQATYTVHPLVKQCTQVWRPPSAEEAAKFDCGAYSAAVTAGCSRPTLPLESALHKLFEAGFDGAAALATVQAAGGYVPSRPAWSTQERIAFEEGLLIEGKNFYRIHRDHVQSRTVREHVEYYYEWKWTPYYDEFVGRNWGFGKFRRKHGYEPGREVDAFDTYPPLVNPPSRMPSPAMDPIGQEEGTLGGPRAFLSSGELQGLEEAVAEAKADKAGMDVEAGIALDVDLSLNVDDLAARRASIGGGAADPLA